MRKSAGVSYETMSTLYIARCFCLRCKVGFEIGMTCM